MIDRFRTRVTGERGALDGYRFRPVFTAAQIHREPLVVLRDLFGGGVFAINPPSRAGRGHHPLYEWRIQSVRRVAPALRILLPHLVVKASQAELVLEFCELPLHRPMTAAHLAERERLRLAVQAAKQPIPPAVASAS